MKRIAAAAVAAAVLLALFSGGAAYALGPLGTLPLEREDTGSLAAGVGYLHREIQLVPRKSGYSAITARQNHHYIQISDESYGWEWSGRLGMADFSDGRRFEAGYKPFGGLGLKGNLYGDRSSDFGLVASFRADLYSRYKIAGVMVAPGLEANVRVKDLWDAEAGLMAHRRFNRLTVYGGPAFEYVEAKIYRTATVPVGFEEGGDSYYKKKSNVGLAGGLSWLQGDTRFVFEGGLSSGGYSAGVEAMFGF